MNIANFKIIFRAFNKQKLSTLLSILVLSVGIASFMVILIYIQYEKSFDKSWNESENIYRIALEKTLKNGNTTTSANNYAGLSRVITNEIPEVQTSTGLWADVVTAYTHDNYLKDVKLFWGDISFFSVFNCAFIAGSGTDPFPTLQSAVISESAAIQLFGTNNPLNERFKLNEGWEFIVAGVFKDIPLNSHLKIDLLISRESLFYYMRHFDANTSTLRIEQVEGPNEPSPLTMWLWQNPQSYTYIRLKNNSNIATVIQDFDPVYKKYTQHLLTNGEKSKFILQPIRSIHFDSHLENELSPNSDRNTIIALNIIAFLILLMSWVIFINFQITQSIERSKEVGLKKIAGAGFSNLSLQVFLLSALINLAGMAMAFVFFLIIHEQLSQYLGISSSLTLGTYLFGFTGTFILGTVIGCLYPSIFLFPKKAQSLLSKNFIQKNDGFNLRRILVVFQFAASIGLLIASTVIILQVQYMKKKNIGLNIQNTIYTYTPMSMIKKDGAFDTLKSFMEGTNQIPGVKGVTVNSCIPGKEINFHSNSVYMTSHPENKGDNFGILTIDHRYEDVFNPVLIAGRMYNIDDRIGNNQLIVNEEAARKLGYNNPEAVVGKYVMISVNDFLAIPESPYQIIGVIKDFHQESLRKPIEPLLLINENRWKYDVGYISILLGNADTQTTIETIKQKWDLFYPDDSFHYRFTSDTYLAQMNADTKLAVIFTGFTVLSIFLAALGLLGITANAAKKRTKEIGIRKVFGARIYDILILLNKEILKWIAVAFIIASPISWYAMQKWLENYAYKTSLNWWIFGTAGVVALAVAFLTVSIQSWNAAARNPVECLRYE
jgi:putative ABC transport system permease protein